MAFLDSLKQTYDESTKSGIPGPIDLIKKGYNAIMPSEQEIQARSQRALLNSGYTPEQIGASPAMAVPSQAAPMAPGPVAPVMPVQVQPISVQPRQMTPVTPVDAYKQAFAQGSQIASAMPSTGLGMQISAAGKAGEIQAQAGQEQAKLFEQQARAMQDSQARLMAQQEEKEKYQREFDTKLDEVQKEDEGKVDFNRYYKNQSTGNKILSGLSLALSVFGGAGSTAKVINMMDDAVNRDIEAQKFEYNQKKEKKGEKIKLLNNSYARMMDKFGDSEKAEAALRALSIDNISNKLNALAAGTNSQLAKTQAENLQGVLRSKKDDIATQLGMSLGQAAATATPAVGQPISKTYTPKTDDERARFVKGIGLAATREDANKIKEGAENIDSFNRNVNRIIELRKKYGSETLPGKVKGEMEALSTELQMSLKKSLGLGVLNQSDYSILTNLVPDPTSLNPRVGELYDSLKNRTNMAFQDNVKYRILNPLQGANVEEKYKGFK